MTPIFFDNLPYPIKPDLPDWFDNSEDDEEEV